MKVCFIPPKGLEQRIGIGGQVLCLAPLVSDDAYRNAVHAAAANGIPIIMDNGIAEGVQLTPRQLFQAYHTFGANELVVPDELGEARKTMDRVTRYLDSIHVTDGDLMAVAQGTDETTVRRVIDNYARWRKITVLGIPRLLGRHIGPDARLNLAKYVDKQYPGRFQIHLLGAQPNWPGEVYAAAKEVPFIRSFDTSLPYNYALAGRQLDPRAVGLTTSTVRPAGYFEHNHVLTDLMIRNEKVIKQWANAGIL